MEHKYVNRKFKKKGGGNSVPRATVDVRTYGDRLLILFDKGEM
jgi:hypothetical protein